VETPTTLPNLEFKIETGDSLLATNPQGLGDFFEAALRDQADELARLKSKYLEAYGSEKRTLHKQIQIGQRSMAESLERVDSPGSVDWRISFAEIFVDQGGFDIVLANPPYIRHERIRSLKKALKQRYPDVYSGMADLYCFFYARGVQLLRSGGVLVFISSNQWLRAAYGRKLRERLAVDLDILSITDFGELPVFESAATFPMILVGQRRPGRAGEEAPTQRPVWTKVRSLDPPYPDVLALQRAAGLKLPKEAIHKDEWLLAPEPTIQRIRQMERRGTRLPVAANSDIYYGIKTGCNQAYIIDEDTKATLNSQHESSAELIRPLAIGDDVRRWHIRNSRRWILLVPIGTDIERYPAVHNHLLPWRDRLESRSDRGPQWWELRACTYYELMSRPKIVFPDIAREPRVTLDADGHVLLNTTYFIPTDDLYLLGVLNSRILWEYYKTRFSVLGNEDLGGRLRFFQQFTNLIPIPPAGRQDRSAIERLVSGCLDARGIDTDAVEAEIDARVRQLFGIS